MPLGIFPSELSSPEEGIRLESTDGGLYSYRVSVSADKIPSLFLRLLKLFPAYATMIVERISEDINRDFDIMMSDPDVSVKEIKSIFKKYEELWVECGFVGFGVIDERTEFEVFINSNKEMAINVPRKDVKKIKRALNSFDLLNKNPSFISDYEHWNYSLSWIVSCESERETDEYIFDYYDIINDLKHLYGFKLTHMHNSNIIKRPKWWNVTVKRLGKCGKRASISTYYIVANTFEEMETLICEKMKEIKAEHYYIYDFYNVEPNDCDYRNLNLIDSKNKNFEDAPFGIWAESDVFICKPKNIASYYINKNYVTA